MTRNRDLKVGDVVDSMPLGRFPDSTTVVVHVGGTCDSHPGNTSLIVHDFDAITGKSTGGEADWCDPSDDEFWTVTGTHHDLAQHWANDNKEDLSNDPRNHYPKLPR